MQQSKDVMATAGNTGTTILHFSGRVATGVVVGAPLGEQVRVRGFDGLRVVDVSVMSKITSGNTYAPTIIIAEKAAEMLL